MKLMRLTWLFATALALGPLPLAAQTQNAQEIRLQEALSSPARSDENKSLDEGRKPIQVIQFLGIKTGDTVVDVIAGRGWYDEVLSAAVGPGGKVYSQNSEYHIKQPGFLEAEKALDQRLGNVEPIHGALPDGIAGKADAALTALNFHDVYNRGGEEVGVKFLKGVYDSLKPGGVFGLIDHIGISGQDNAKLHRVPIEAAKAALLKAGFVIEAESDLLRNPQDNHTLFIKDPSLRWHTDRMLIRARKPK